MESKKLKIIIVNYRYFISGGPERYLFNIKELLEKEGHEIIPFSVKSNHNVHSEYEPYFLEPIGKGKEVYFSDYSKTNLKTIFQTFSRMFYSFEAKRKLDKLIKMVSPDLIYVLHYQNKISASIFDAAKKNNIPVIHRISDFGQICANALFFRPKQKDICERCLTGSKINAIKNKCVYDSYLYSAFKATSLELQRFLNITKKVNAFVIPSKFTLSKLQEAGFPPEKLINIPTFFNFPKTMEGLKIEYNPFALYIGRIEAEKGLLTLVKAFEQSGKSLKIIGFSSTGFDLELKEYLKEKSHNIEFLGKMEFNEMQQYLQRCAFTIVPSEWYDNFPNTILESFAFKKCVVATNTGSLKEIVIDNKTGMLFRLKDVEDLVNKINFLFENIEVCIYYGENAYQKLITEFSSEKHLEKLLHLFNRSIFIK